MTTARIQQFEACRPQLKKMCVDLKHGDVSVGPCPECGQELTISREPAPSNNVRGKCVSDGCLEFVSSAL